MPKTMDAPAWKFVVLLAGIEELWQVDFCQMRSTHPPSKYTEGPAKHLNIVY